MLKPFLRTEMELMIILCLEPEFVLVSACKRSILSKHSVRFDDNKLQNAQMHMLKTIMSQEDTHETLKFEVAQVGKDRIALAKDRAELQTESQRIS